MKPTIDPERIKEIYSELSQMSIELDSDPLQFGPKRLNGKVAEARGILTRCERVFLQVSQDLHWFKRNLRRVQAEFDINMQDLLTNDPEVMAGRNMKDREAIATTRLASLRDEVYDLSSSMEDLEHLMIVIRAKRSDLRDVQGRLRDQLKICQEEIGLGAKWGSNKGGFSDIGSILGDLDSLIEREKKSPSHMVDQALDQIPINGVPEDAFKSTESLPQGLFDSFHEEK